MQGEILRQLSWNTVAVRVFSTDEHCDVVLQLQPSVLKCPSALLTKASIFTPVPCVIEHIGRYNGRVFYGGKITVSEDATPPCSWRPMCMLPVGDKPRLGRPRTHYFD
jgi:hypothetical protein